MRGKCVFDITTQVEKTGATMRRFKARWFFMGNRRIMGIEFTETFAPVAKFTTIHVILDIVAEMGWELHQMDVKTAFLHGEFHEAVYVERPEEFFDSTISDAVCGLLHAFYCLTPAKKMRYAKLDVFLVNKLGFEHVNGNPCFDGRQSDGYAVIITVYVGDALIAASSITVLNEIKEPLGERFEMKDIGAAWVILGVEIQRDRDAGTLKMTQSMNASQVLEEIKMSDCKARSAPSRGGRSPPWGSSLTGPSQASRMPTA